MGILKVLLTVGVALLFGVHLLVHFLQEKMIFYPEKLDPGFSFRFSKPFTELSIESGNAVLNALRFRAENPKGIIVYFHGNAGSLRDWGEVAAELTGFGYDVLIYDYRGYGKSTGHHRSEADLISDARAVLAYARKEFPEEKIVLYGRSLGSGIAVQIAAEMKPKRLILETPYRSVKEVGTDRYPFIGSFALRYPLRSDLFAPRVSAPVAIFHGTEDEVLPYSGAERLAGDFTSPPEFHRIPGGHHSDLESFPQFQTALAKILTN